MLLPFVIDLFYPNKDRRGLQSFEAVVHIGLCVFQISSPIYTSTIFQWTSPFSIYPSSLSCLNTPQESLGFFFIFPFFWKKCSYVFLLSYTFSHLPEFSWYNNYLMFPLLQQLLLLCGIQLVFSLYLSVLLFLVNQWINKSLPAASLLFHCYLCLSLIHLSLHCERVQSTQTALGFSSGSLSLYFILLGYTFF